MELSNVRIVNALLVDDDPEDIDLTLEVMNLSKIKVNVSVAYDGIEAIEYLNNLIDENKLLPDLILLDLNMPKMNGLEVLDYIKKNGKLKIIPVVILTTSNNQYDIEQSYNKGISCFVTKPVGLDEFQNVVRAIKDFWFSVVKFPDN